MRFRLLALLLVFGLVSTLGVSAKAQVTVRPHLHAGVNTVQPLFDVQPILAGINDHPLRPGFTGGGGLTAIGSGWVGAEADLLFERIHLVEDWFSDTAPYEWRAHTRANYLSLPIMALVRPAENLSPSPFLNAGPFLAVKLSESKEVSTEECGELGCDESAGPAFTRATYGLIVGAGVRTEVRSRDLRIHVRYRRGVAETYMYFSAREASVHSATLMIGLSL